MTDYRSLTIDEIELMEHQGCTAEDWDALTVVDGFDAHHVSHVHFSGNVMLGALEGQLEVSAGFHRHSGIHHAVLHNVTIGDNCLVENIGNHIANYVIGDDCIIANVALMETTEGATYGEGNLVSVLSEAGAGNLTLFHGLSSQLAFLMVSHAADKEFTEALRKMIAQEVESSLPECGTIGNSVKIVNSTEIVNTVVGDDCEISGAMRLSDCTILSSPNNAAFIGADVIAESTIVDEGASLTDGAQLHDCFVGEACHVSNGFSASASAFFANSYMSNGEACAALCGPFSASHHKSTLLIGASMMFYNAGSATNFSNHAYKMGPLHYGSLGRGTKTASGAHLLLPAQIGAFSVCLNKISNHPDTRCLPFSYIIGAGDHTAIVPGRNLSTVGLYRDVNKWPRRDQRPQQGRKSLVSHEWLSPQTVSDVLRGLAILEDLQQQCGVLAAEYPYQGAVIRRSSLEKGLRLYGLALRLFYGKALLQHKEMLSEESTDCSDAQGGLSSEMGGTPAGDAHWTDVGGLLMPVAEEERLVDDVRRGRLATAGDVQSRFQKIHANYEAMQWQWALPRMLEHYEISSLTEENRRMILADYEQARSQWLALIRRDAEREYAMGDVEEGVLLDFLKLLEKEPVR